MRRVLILAIGNELLIGETLDTNTHWLCRRLTTLGARIERAVLLPDILPVIAQEVRAGVAAGFDLIITTGGLGPTEDDLTLAAIASALELTLERNETAYQWVVEKYRDLAARGYVAEAAMSAAREKMAILPAGATAVMNPVGAAPAVELRSGKTVILALPGVPSEMHGIVSESWQPRLLELLGSSAVSEGEIWVECGDESLLAPVLKQVVSNHPEVYIKSKAKGFGPDQLFQVILHVRAATTELAAEALQRARAELTDAFLRAGISPQRHGDQDK